MLTCTVRSLTLVDKIVNTYMYVLTLDALKENVCLLSVCQLCRLTIRCELTLKIGDTLDLAL